MVRVKLFLAALLLTAFAFAFGNAAFADGGPLILCPPKAKWCRCTLPTCN
jgi:hypothetical protein